MGTNSAGADASCPGLTIETRIWNGMDLLLQMTPAVDAMERKIQLSKMAQLRDHCLSLILLEDMATQARAQPFWYNPLFSWLATSLQKNTVYPFHSSKFSTETYFGSAN